MLLAVQIDGRTDICNVRVVSRLSRVIRGGGELRHDNCRKNRQDYDDNEQFHQGETFLVSRTS
jgi:hypothetical protein